MEEKINKLVIDLNDNIYEPIMIDSLIDNANLSIKELKYLYCKWFNVEKDSLNGNKNKMIETMKILLRSELNFKIIKGI